MKQIEIHKTYTLLLIPIPPNADPADAGLSEEIFSQIIRHKHALVIQRFRTARRAIQLLSVAVGALIGTVWFLAVSALK